MLVTPTNIHAQLWEQTLTALLTLAVMLLILMMAGFQSKGARELNGSLSPDQSRQAVAIGHD